MISNGGASMTATMTMTTTTKTTGSAIGRRRVLASAAMLLGAILTIMLLPAYGQQDVDPTWYDPWASAATVANPAQPPAEIHLSQSPVSTLRYQQTERPVSAAADAGKFRVKDTQLDQSRHNPARKSGETPSADSRLPGAARLAGFETRASETRATASVPRGGV